MRVRLICPESLPAILCVQGGAHCFVFVVSCVSFFSIAVEATASTTLLISLRTFDVTYIPVALWDWTAWVHYVYQATELARITFIRVYCLPLYTTLKLLIHHYYLIRQFPFKHITTSLLWLLHSWPHHITSSSSNTCLSTVHEFVHKVIFIAF